MNFDYDDDGYPRQPSAGYWDSILSETVECVFPESAYITQAEVLYVRVCVGRWRFCRR